MAYAGGRLCCGLAQLDGPLPGGGIALGDAYEVMAGARAVAAHSPDGGCGLIAMAAHRNPCVRNGMSATAEGHPLDARAAVAASEAPFCGCVL